MARKRCTAKQRKYGFCGKRGRRHSMGRIAPCGRTAKGRIKSCGGRRRRRAHR